mgnify:CR=1 FL=1
MRGCEKSEVSISLRLPKSLYEDLKRYSVIRRWSMSKAVKKILQEVVRYEVEMSDVNYKL